MVLQSDIARDTQKGKSTLYGLDSMPLPNLLADRSSKMKSFMLMNQVSSLIDKAFANEDFSV